MNVPDELIRKIVMMGRPTYPYLRDDYFKSTQLTNKTYYELLEPYPFNDYHNHEPTPPTLRRWHRFIFYREIDLIENPSHYSFFDGGVVQTSFGFSESDSD